MQKISIQTIKTAALVLALGLASGCATTGQIDEVQAIANNALNEARAANAAASAAAGAAAQAQQTADDALACCNANSAKFDRMFEMGMQK